MEQTKKQNDDPFPYNKIKSPAFVIKVFLQTFIGLGVFFLLLNNAIFELSGWDGLLFLRLHEIIKQMKTLEIVGHGLAYAAGIELAYMLFTPGPDEAIEPVILGLASALLLTISNASGKELTESVSIVIYVVALGLLFTIRAIFVAEAKIFKSIIWLEKLIEKFKRS